MEEMNKIMIKKFFLHLHLVNKHRWIVFKLCVKAGIPFRGLLHDLSKYSPTEFWESVKFYNGSHSPILEAREVNGYSKAWLHHKGRNKHHSEYWYDSRAKVPSPIMPYKYVVEMICDKLAAGIAYNGKNWTNSTQKEYWKRNKDTELLNENVKNLLTEAFEQVSIQGIDKTVTSKNLKSLYKKYCIDERI